MNVGDTVIVYKEDDSYGWTEDMTDLMHTPTKILEIIEVDIPYAELEIDDGEFSWPLACLTLAEGYLPAEDPL